MPTDCIDCFHRLVAFGVITISLNPLETRPRERRSHGSRWTITCWRKRWPSASFISRVVRSNRPDPRVLWADWTHAGVPWRFERRWRRRGRELEGMRGLLFTFTHNITFIVKGEPGFCRQQRRSMDIPKIIGLEIRTQRSAPPGTATCRTGRPRSTRQTESAPRLCEQLMETSSRIPPGHKAWSGNAFLIPSPSKASVRNSATFTDPNLWRLCHQRIYETQAHASFPMLIGQPSPQSSLDGEVNYHFTHFHPKSLSAPVRTKYAYTTTNRCKPVTTTWQSASKRIPPMKPSHIFNTENPF